MMTADVIFKAFGGGQIVAEILGVSAQAVSNMKARGSIPSRHWPRLVAEAKERAPRPDTSPEQAAVLRDVTFENLANIQPPSEAAA
jgi:hypothetical protein